MIKRERKTGFTLIELLVTIAILSIVLLIVGIIVWGSFRDSDKKIDLSTKKLILDISNDYALEYRDSEAWKEEVNGDEASFCVSLNSLVTHGYFKGVDIDRYKDDYIVKTTIKNGIYDSKLIKKEELDLDDCSYYKDITSIVGVDNSVTDIEENGNKIGDFSYSIDSVSNKQIKTSINFSLDFNIKEMITSAPVYITLIVDNSGSMENNNVYDDAIDAAVNFSEVILAPENVPDANIALVLYNDTPKLKRVFKNSILSYSDFSEAVGNTNIASGIDYVSSMIHVGKNNGTIPQNASFYTLLLYDGYPTHYPYFDSYNSVSIKGDNSKINYYFSNFISNNKSKSCYETLTECRLFFCYTSGIDYNPCNEYILASGDYLKNIYNSKLILFGYEINEGERHLFNEEELKKMASYDSDFCSDSDYANYCYYDSTSDSVLGLFENISTQIIDTEKSINANRVFVKLIPTKIDNGESAFEIMKDGSKVQDNMIVIEEDISSLEESMKISLSESYDLVLNDSLFSGCAENDCSKELKLFDISVIFEYDNKEPEEFEIDNPISVVVGSKREYSIN